MGLLDDAIREHLELKRRRGADPSEIERQESEALGPVRREAAPATVEPGPHADEPAGLEDPGAAYAEDLPDVDRPHLADPPTTHERPYAESEAESATPPHGDPYQPTREFSTDELEAALGERRAGADREDAGAISASAAAEAAEAEAEGEAGGAEPPEGADELEETPDFLQETPEHDRLWFEQKPPKDFDF